jgi:hypothetical protein
MATNAAQISNHAAGLAAAALLPEVPDERVYVDERDDFALPHAWVYVEAAAASGTIMYDGTLVAHVWAANYSVAADLAERVASALPGFHSLPDGGAYRVKRGGTIMLREDDAAHGILRFPIRYDAPV